MVWKLSCRPAGHTGHTMSKPVETAGQPTKIKVYRGLLQMYGDIPLYINVGSANLGIGNDMTSGPWLLIGKATENIKAMTIIGMLKINTMWYLMLFKKSQLHSNHDKLCMSSLFFGFVITFYYFLKRYKSTRIRIMPNQHVTMIRLNGIWMKTGISMHFHCFPLNIRIAWAVAMVPSLLSVIHDKTPDTLRPHWWWKCPGLETHRYPRCYQYLSGKENVRPTHPLYQSVKQLSYVVIVTQTCSKDS